MIWEKFKYYIFSDFNALFSVNKIAEGAKHCEKAVSFHLFLLTWQY